MAISLEDFEARRKRYARASWRRLAESVAILAGFYVLLFWALSRWSSDIPEAWRPWGALAVGLLQFVGLGGTLWYLSRGLKKLQPRLGLVCPGCGALLMWARWRPERSNGNCTKCEYQIVAGPIGPPPRVAPKWPGRLLSPGHPSPGRVRVLVLGGLGVVTVVMVGLIALANTPLKNRRTNGRSPASTMPTWPAPRLRSALIPSQSR